MGPIAPVGGDLVNIVGSEDDLGAGEVVAHPEVDPGEDEQVVEDVVAGEVGGLGDIGVVLGEEVGDVAQLGKEKEDPWFSSAIEAVYCTGDSTRKWLSQPRSG